MMKIFDKLWNHYCLAAIVCSLLGILSAWQSFRRGELLCRWYDEGINIPVTTTARVSAAVLILCIMSGISFGLAFECLIEKGNKYEEEDS